MDLQRAQIERTARQTEGFSRVELQGCGDDPLHRRPLLHATRDIPEQRLCILQRRA